MSTGDCRLHTSVEQNLVLSRLIVEFARHPLLGDELVFPGGTCFHELSTDPGATARTSTTCGGTHGGFGDIVDAIRSVAGNIGFEGITTQIDNLDAKLAVDDFAGDLDQLVNVAPNGHSVDAHRRSRGE